MTKPIRKLSDAQLYALDLASRYKLQRSSMGWWAVGPDGSALSDPVEILAPATWANERARTLLAQIARDIDWSQQGEWSPTVFH